MCSKKRKLELIMDNSESGFDSNNLVSSTPMTSRMNQTLLMSGSEESSELLNNAYFSLGSPKTPDFMSPITKQSLYESESGLKLEFQINSQDTTKENWTMADDSKYKECTRDDYVSFDFSLEDNYITSLEKCISKKMCSGISDIYSKNDPMTSDYSSHFSSKRDGSKDSINKSKLEDVVDKNTPSLAEACRSNTGNSDMEISFLGINESLFENVTESDMFGSPTVKNENILGYNQFQNAVIHNTEERNPMHLMSLLEKTTASDSLTADNESVKNVFLGKDFCSGNPIETMSRRNEIKNESMQTIENDVKNDSSIFSNIPDQEMSSEKKNNCFEENPESTWQTNVFEKCNEGMNVDIETPILAQIMIPSTNTDEGENSKTGVETIKAFVDNCSVTVLPKDPDDGQNREVLKQENNSCTGDKYQVLQVINPLEKCTEARNADNKSQIFTLKIMPTIKSNLSESSETEDESMQIRESFPERGIILDKTRNNEPNQVNSNKERLSCYKEKVYNSPAISPFGKSADSLSADIDSQELVPKSISITDKNVSSSEYSCTEIRGNNLALNEKGVHFVSAKLKVDIQNLLDLFEVDNIISKRILVALSNEFFGSGVTQKDVLQLLREDPKLRTIAKLRENVGAFLKAAVNAEIIEIKKRRYYLKFETQKGREVVLQNDQTRNMIKNKLPKKPRHLHTNEGRSKLKAPTVNKKGETSGASKKDLKKAASKKPKRSVHRMQLRSSKEMRSKSFI